MPTSRPSIAERILLAICLAICLAIVHECRHPAHHEADENGWCHEGEEAELDGAGVLRCEVSP